MIRQLIGHTFTGEGSPIAEKALIWPARNCKLALKLTLDQAANYYRINRSAGIYSCP